MELHKTKQQIGQCIVRALLVLGRATGKFELTRFTTARTWGKPPPSPLYYTLCLATGPAPKCHFVSRLPSGSPEIPTIRTPATLGVHNFACKPPIEMRSEAKLQPSSRAFQIYVAHHMNMRKSERLSTFSGRESNYQFDSRPFFWP